MRSMPHQIFSVLIASFLEHRAPRFDKATRASNPAKGLVHYLGRLKKARWRGSARKIAKFGLKVQKYNQLVVAAVVVSTS